jgi:hypothetical protein
MAMRVEFSAKELTEEQIRQDIMFIVNKVKDEIKSPEFIPKNIRCHLVFREHKEAIERELAKLNICYAINSGYIQSVEYDPYGNRGIPGFDAEISICRKYTQEVVTNINIYR